MSKMLWKQNNEQLVSVKALLGELWDDAAILDLPGVEGVEQITWMMKKVMLLLQGKIVKIGMDATCEMQSEH